MPALKVGDVMTREVYAVGPLTSLDTVGRLLAVRHFSGVPVIEPDGHVLGVITEADLVDPDRERSSQVGGALYYHVTADGIEPLGEATSDSEGCVRDLMIPMAFGVTAESSLLDAIHLMLLEDVHRVIVVREGILAGILTSMDVLRAVARSSGLEVAESADIIDPMASPPGL
jgi:CBS domain-containing protein